jgi:hypothetical protein
MHSVHTSAQQADLPTCLFAYMQTRRIPSLR